MTALSGGEPALQDRAILRAEIDGATVSARVTVVNLRAGAIWLGLGEPDPQLARLRPGDPVQLTFLHDGAAKVAASTFKSHLGTPPSRLLAVDWRGVGQALQRRSHLRMDIECPVEYTVVTQSDRSVAGLRGNGSTRNISAGGLQFEVEAPLEETANVGDGLDVLLTFGDDMVMAEADVVRVERCDEPADAGGFGGTAPKTLIAVQFVAIDQAAQDCIVHHIFSLLRHRKDETTPGESGAPRFPGTPRLPPA